MTNYDDYNEKITKLFPSPNPTSKNDNSKMLDSNHNFTLSHDNSFSGVKYKENKIHSKVAEDKSENQSERKAKRILTYNYSRDGLLHESIVINKTPYLPSMHF